jgi:bacteriocin biosynthesis cyclodehydratase domain-containing protein
VTVQTMRERPWLKPWYRLARRENTVVLEYGQTALVFEGAAAVELLPALLPLLDGNRTVAEIVRELGEAAGPAVHHALDLLERHHLLTDRPSGGAAAPGDALAFHAASSGRNLSVAAVAETLAAAEIVAVGGGRLAEELARLLRVSGAARVRRAPIDVEVPRGVELAVVAPEPTELPSVTRWNRRALDAGVSWLQVLPYDGRYAALGPLFIPGETCCFECFRIRRASTLHLREELRFLDEVPAAHPSSPAFSQAVAGLAASLALRWLVEQDRSLPGTLYALELGAELRLAPHRVLRVPRCPTCSAASGVAQPLPWFEESVA